MTRLMGLVGIAVFYGIVLAVGLWGARRRRSDSTSELFVAGRRIPLWLGIFTMTATWVDGGYLNATAEAVYAQGLAYAQPPWGYALSLLLGGIFFASVMHANGFTTMLDPFQRRYGDRVGAVLYIPAFLGELFWTAGILAALGTTFAVLFELDVTRSIVVSSAITILYTVMGGLWSIAYTDVVQLLMAFAGMMICIPFVLGHFPSLWDVWGRYQAVFGSKAALLPPWGALDHPQWGRAIFTWWDGLLLLVFGGIPWHCYFQRVLSSPTAIVARRLSCWAALCCIVMAVPPAIIGMAGAAFDWQAHGIARPAEAYVVMPYILKHLTPPWVGILGLCAVAGAIMSSVDASMYSAASMFAWNVYRKIFDPGARPEDMKWVLRGSVLSVGVLATLVALTVKSIFALWFLCADLVYVLLFPQLLLVLYVRRVTSLGVLAGLAVGLFLRLGGGEPMLGIPAFIPYPADGGVVWFPFKTAAMLSGLLATLAVSRLRVRGAISHPVPWIQGPAVTMAPAD